MAYYIGQTINEAIPPLWGEERAFLKKNLFSIEPNKLPPVNYDSFIMNSHSLTHIEAESHVVKSGKNLDFYFNDLSYFIGPSLVVKLKGNRYVQLENGKTWHWEVSKNELQSEMNRVLGNRSFPGKILLTTENYPVTSYGYHDPDYVLTLSQEAADYLISLHGFNLYGTTWKSSDYKPGSLERPIHKTLFKKAVILECLDLSKVPEGVYQLNAVPLKIEGASESPASPILY